MWELRVGGGADPARPGRYITHRRTVGPFAVPAGWAKGDMLPRPVRKALGSFVADVQAGRVSTATLTFGELLDRYLETLEDQDKQKSTLRTYRSYIRQWLRGGDLERMPIGTITADDLDKVYKKMIAAGRAPSTINQVHAIVRKAFNIAIAKEWTDRNPAVRTTSRPTVRRKKRAPAEVGALLRTVKMATVEDQAIGVFILLAAGTGARRGELCGLQLPDLDWEGERIHVVRAIGRDDDGSRMDTPEYERTYGEIDLEVKEPKDFQERWVDVPSPVMHALKIHVAVMDERARWAQVDLAGDAYLFSSSADGADPWKPDWVTAAFARARVRAGTQSLKLKDTRHLLGSTMHQQGVPLIVIQEALGHERGSGVTMDHYIDSTPGAGRQAAATLNAALGFDDWLEAMNIDLPDSGESDGVESGVA